MTIEMLLVVSMAVVTAGLRLSGFGVAHFLMQFPKVKSGLLSSGFCLITSYLAVQLWEHPSLALPVCITSILSYAAKGILLPLLIGWIVAILMLNFPA
jgi:uncharacterized membrane protein